MKKKLMLLAAGALTALAFTALPGAVSAKETTLKCEKTPCTFTVAGGVYEVSAVRGDTTRCESVSGNGEAINLDASDETTTAEVKLTFHGCRETNSGFGFSCTSSGQPTGTIKAEPAVAHVIALPGTPAEAGVLITNVKTTLTCAGGFARTTTTGSLIGENEARCGAAASATQKINFETTGDGAQKIRTYTGKTYNLLWATNHNTTPTATSGYENAAQAGTLTLTWNQNVQVTCAE